MSLVVICVLLHVKMELLGEFANIFLLQTILNYDDDQMRFCVVVNITQHIE